MKQWRRIRVQSVGIGEEKGIRFEIEFNEPFNAINIIFRLGWFLYEGKKRNSIIMCRLNFCLIILILAGISVHAQMDSSVVSSNKNSIFIEFGGNASGEGANLPEFFSINYDRYLFGNDFSKKTTLRIGCNFPAIGDHYYQSKILVVPLLINRLYGKKNLFFEMGIGGAFILDGIGKNIMVIKGGKTMWAFTSVLGMRYLSWNNRIVARIGLTPTFGYKSRDLYVGSIVGVSAGYSF